MRVSADLGENGVVLLTQIRGTKSCALSSQAGVIRSTDTHRLHDVDTRGVRCRRLTYSDGMTSAWAE